MAYSIMTNINLQCKTLFVLITIIPDHVIYGAFFVFGCSPKPTRPLPSNMRKPFQDMELSNLENNVNGFLILFPLGHMNHESQYQSRRIYLKRAKEDCNIFAHIIGF